MTVAAPPPNYALKLPSAAIGRAMSLAACGRARSLTLIRYAAGAAPGWTNNGAAHSCACAPGAL